MLDFIPPSIRSRWPLIAEIYNRPWCKRLVLLWVILGSWDLFISQFIPEETAKKFPKAYQVVDMTTGWLTWQQWAFLGIAVLAACSFEYAFRQRQRHGVVKPSVAEGPKPTPPLADDKTRELAGIVNAVLERALQYDFKYPMPKDDPYVANHEALKNSPHPVWTDQSLNQLRRDFINRCGILGTTHNLRCTIQELEDLKVETKAIARSIIARLLGQEPEATHAKFGEQSAAPDSNVRALVGTMEFAYSTNNGAVSVGDDNFRFKLAFSKAGNESIHMYASEHNRHSNLKRLARVKNARSGTLISFHNFDSSSSSYTLRVGEHFIAQNADGYFMQGKLLVIDDDFRGRPRDMVKFKYSINTNGSAEFIAL